MSMNIGVTFRVIIGVVTVSQLLPQDRRRRNDHDGLAKKLIRWRSNSAPDELASKLRNFLATGR